MTLRFVVIACCLALPLKADRITTKNGRTLRGEVISESPGGLRINLGNGLITVVRHEDIQTHEKEPLPETLLYLGSREMKSNMLSRALKTLTRAHELDPDNANIRQTLGKAWMYQANEETDRRHPASALKALNKAKSLLPKDANIEAAIQRVQEALSVLDTMEKKAFKLAIQGEHLKAVNLFDDLLRQDLSRASKLRETYAECLVALGDEEIKKQRWSAAADFYDVALRHSPDLIATIEDRWASSHLNPTFELIENGELEVALENIREVLDLIPDNDNALFYHGAVLSQLDKTEQANKAFRKILVNHGKNPGKLSTSELADKAKEFFKGSFEIISIQEAKNRISQSLAGDWKEFSGNNWTVYHHSPYFADQLKLVLDDVLLRVSQELSGKSNMVAMDPELHIYIYRNEKEYQKALGESMGWSAAITRTTEVNGVIRHRRIMTFQSAQLVRSTIPHELVHVLLPIILEKPPSQIPHWFNEGMSVRFEPSHKTEFYRLLVDEARAGHSLFALEDLIDLKNYPSSEERVKLYYAQCYVLTDYLVKTHGMKKVLDWARSCNKKNAAERLVQMAGPLDKLEDKIFNH